MRKLIAHTLVVHHDRFLITRRSEYKPDGTKTRYGGWWDFPGGLVENSELPQQAAIREIEEETGLNVELESIVYENSNYDESVNTVFTTLIYVAASAGNKVTLSFEHSEYAWVKFSEYDNGVYQYVPYIMPSLKKYLEIQAL